tara:strand:- start:10336 stop:10674 length:339 start_codon:yes stop_codon:yes gene_type:complete
MDINYLKESLQRRIDLKNLYPKLIGRHNFFDGNLEKIKSGIKMLEEKDTLTYRGKRDLYDLGREFINIRNYEIKFHNSRITTLFGNVIHDCETELYSLALDVFQTYGINKQH